MKELFTLLFVFCAFAGWAQEPLLTTCWTQEYPYNQHCPADPLENYDHSYAGCPAVVMGQILNHLRTTQGTRLDDGDDYFTGNYFGRQFHIDDDWEEYDFPSFPELNEMLDSVDARFLRGEELTESLAGALVFACGVACKQVYSASDSYGSGTFSVDQAYEAYLRFGFDDCMLLRELDSAAHALMIANLQAGYPVHLAVENPAGTSGHNVVVDGYRESDGRFHLNFGWGGYRDNWYHLPDANGFSYGWSKVEGIILNLIPSAPLAVGEPARLPMVEVYPNPATEVLYLKDLPCEEVAYAIYNVMGQRVAGGSSRGEIPVAELGKGVYLLQLEGEGYRGTSRFQR